MAIRTDRQVPFQDGFTWVSQTDPETPCPGALPLVVLHGGPGFTHHYVKNLRELADQTSDQAIVTAIVRMAQSLHMATLAEGVETAEQARLLQDLGCGEIQGYWYSRPLEPADFEAFARQAAQQASHSAA